MILTVKPSYDSKGANSKKMESRTQLRTTVPHDQIITDPSKHKHNQMICESKELHVVGIQTIVTFQIKTNQSTSFEFYPACGGTFMRIINVTYQRRV